MPFKHQLLKMKGDITDLFLLLFNAVLGLHGAG